MAELPTSIRRKLASSIRLLASDREGEILAAARAIPRTLNAAGADLHTFADLIEQINGGKLSEAEMKKLYDAGYEAGRADGVRAADAKLHHDEDGFRSVDGAASWHRIARFYQDRSARLRGNELDFVDDMVGLTVWREPTPKQAKWLRGIYTRLGGRLPP